MEPFIAMMVMFGGTFAPRAWAHCQGQLLAISSNSALFSLIGTTYGGDGRTSFQLPDLRGRVAVGHGEGPGLTDPGKIGHRFGAETTTLTVSNLPAHDHSATLSGLTVQITASTATGVSEVPGGANTSLATGEAEVQARTGVARIYGPPPAVAEEATLTGGSVGGTVTIDTAGGGTGFHIMQPAIVINHIIALQGVFPSRN